ncbi:MAG: methylmalonyl-CoA epimerase [Chloroflexota bacterium]|nr:methylmalonyl-CoA epimerase [Chloroflexota bacterium]MDE3101896.1 methylmalonyl-CoA epimerase [Chloroflexota bacterium]
MSPLVAGSELHHVGIAVPSIEAALPLYADVLGLRAGAVRELPDQAVRAVVLAGGAARVELIEPLDASSGVARFLTERGRPTLHHVCFAVDDLARVLAELAAAGTELIDREPRRGIEGMVAFLHPRAGDGVLIELIDRASLEAGRERAQRSAG